MRDAGCRIVSSLGPGISGVESPTREGDSPVCCLDSSEYGTISESRVAWDRSLNVGGKLHPKLNTVHQTDSEQVP